MASATSRLTCFAAVNRRHKNTPCSFPSPILRPQSWVELGCERIGRTSLSYASNSQKAHVERAENSSPSEEHEDVNSGTVEQKRAAKIHDFCFGIPFGGIVLSGGLIGFVFSRNPATLTSGVLYGGALLALSTFSLKIWRQGKSSLPYILGQGALAAALLWKNFQSFSVTKKVFPTGFYAFISGAMLCFYSYVLLSGGNPPPKKLKSSPSVAS